jgi:hypothetical protein
MANRIINPGSRHFNSQGTAPLSGGLMYFYEVGTLNPKDTYADEEALTPNSNPVVLSAGGLEPNIFLDGAYRVILKDSSGVQIWDRDNVNSSPLSPFQQWVPTIPYPLNWVVIGSDGYFYVSQVNNNLGDDPTSSPTEWFLFGKSIGIPDSPNGNILVIDTSEDQGVGSVTPATLKTLVPISTVSASAVATVDFTGISNAFDEYEVHILNAIPANDSVDFFIRTSANAGVSYDSGASDYSYGAMTGTPSGGGATVTGSTGAAQISLSVGVAAVGSAANENGVSIKIELIRPSESTYTQVNWSGSFVADDAAINPVIAGGNRLSAAAVNAVRFFFSTGNIESGIFTLYGVRRT